jgi:polar amino acid transport system substrate-binding protein
MGTHAKGKTSGKNSKNIPYIEPMYPFQRQKNDRMFGGKMKKIIIGCLLFMVGTCNLILSALPKEIVVGYHEDFPPYFYMENGDLLGIFPEMINEAAKKIGIRVKYRMFPWKRMLRSARMRRVDAIFPLFKTRERTGYLFFPDNGIALGESVFFTHKDSNINYSGDLNQLSSYSIGCVKDYSYGEEFENANYLQKDECPTDKALVEKFISGRFQVGAGSDEVIKYYAETLGVWDKIKFLDPPLLRKILYIGFSRKKGWDELARKFSETIAELGKEGIHQRILNKYGRGEDMVFFKELVIGADLEDYPPYSYWKNGQVKGIGPEIINRVAENIGVKIRYQGIKWGDFPGLIEKGEINAVMPLFKTGEREQILYFPINGLVAEKNYFITWKNSGIKYSGDMRDLKGISIGVVKNYSYGENFDKAEYLKKKSYPGVELLMINLKNKKVKVAIGEYRVIQYFIKELGISDKVEFLEPPLPREFLYLAFSKNKSTGFEKLSRSFSDAIGKLRLRGTYHEIFKAHGIDMRKLVLAADNWLPYYGDNLTNFGPLAEIINEAFKRVDYQVQIDFMPWSNLLDKVRKGKYDGGFTASYTLQKKEGYFFSNPIARSSPIVFLKRRDAHVVYNRIEDLHDYRIGVVRDFVYEPGFDNTPGLQRIVANSAEVNIHNLLKGRLDLVIIDQAHARYLLDRMSPDESNKLEFIDLYPSEKEAETRQDLHLIISKESVEAEQIMIDFNHGLKQIKEDETFNKILKKHGVIHEILKK